MSLTIIFYFYILLSFSKQFYLLRETKMVLLIYTPQLILVAGHQNKF